MPAARARGVLGEAVDVREVLGRLRERHDVAPGGARAEPLLHEGDGAEDVEHLCRPARCAARRPRARRAPWRAPRVLAHLELGEVEPERLDLPDQVLQAAVGLARAPRRDERVLHDAQVGEQLLGVAVREVGVARAGRGDAAGDEQQDAAVGLGGGALGDLGRGVLVGGGEPLPQREQAALGGVVAASRVSVRPMRSAVRSSPMQHVLRRDRGRLAGDGCRDEGVAVAVAADPRADADEGLARRARADRRRCPAARRPRGGRRAAPRCRASRRRPP